MYGQSTRAASRRSRGRAGNTVKKKANRERARLIQLMICLVLFLMVFVGKGVFPQRVQQVGGQLLALIGENTDFRQAFAQLGQSLAQQESVLGEIGEFCVEVFGAKSSDAVPAWSEAENISEEERQFLNSEPDQASLTAHYLRLDQVPESWFSDTAEQSNEEAEQPVPELMQIPAVGTIMLHVDYQGPELPEGYTMDQLSLGNLETTTPVMGTLWSQYGYRDHPIDGDYKFHNGVDIGADFGKDIGAFAAGTVEYIGENETYGNYLQIDHGQGIKSFYAHCSKLCVQQGQEVARGEKVAEVGATGNATGPHLHFELKCAGQHIDPAYYIQYKTP